MAFKMKGFPLRSGFKHTGGRHEDHHGSGYGGVINKESDDTSDVEETKNVTNELSEKDYDKMFKPVVENEAYIQAKLKKAMDKYLYLKDQIDRGVYGDNPPKLPPMPTEENIEDFDTNTGSYRF